MEPISRELCIVTPVYNDWTSFSQLVRTLGTLLAGEGISADILAVDDCSTLPAMTEIPRVEGIGQVRVLRLQANVGHQRAIAIGLMHLAGEGGNARIAVMDSDGEDRPEELVRMLVVADAHPQSVIVAQRHKRSEGLLFRAFYWVYLQLFAILTGHRIRFGNFTILPRVTLMRIINSPHIWNNFAATLVQSGLPIRYVPTVRGVRYAGRSRMNFVGLVAHGLGAIAVFSDAVFVRILIASTGIFAVSVAAALMAISLRLFATYTFPGWATNVLGFALLASLQAVMTPILIAFLLLSNRAQVQLLPRTLALNLVDEVRTL